MYSGIIVEFAILAYQPTLSMSIHGWLSMFPTLHWLPTNCIIFRAQVSQICIGICISASSIDSNNETSYALGPNYIRPNQSYLYSHERRQKQLQQEYEKIMSVVTAYLVHTYHMPQTSTIIKQFSNALASCLYDRYMAPISYLSIHRARKEWKLLKSIQFRVKKGKYVLRVTDKSGIFHLGDTDVYRQKAADYQQKTAAYMEVEDNPLWDIFDKVVHLLNDLRSKKRIHAWQFNQMMPKRNKVALAYLYFVPKPHKVTHTPGCFLGCKKYSVHSFRKELRCDRLSRQCTHQQLAFSSFSTNYCDHCLIITFAQLRSSMVLTCFVVLLPMLKMARSNQQLSCVHLISQICTQCYLKSSCWMFWQNFSFISAIARWKACQLMLFGN